MMSGGGSVFEDSWMAAGETLDASGIRGPEPRADMRVVMSEAGWNACRAHGFPCPDSRDELGTVIKVLGAGDAAHVRWDGGLEGDWLCGKFDQFMLLSAESAQSPPRVSAVAAANETLQGLALRAWWKGTIKVLVRDDAGGQSTLGRLVRMAVVVDGQPNELMLPARCIVPPSPPFRSSDAANVQPWWEYNTAVRITGTSDSELDGNSALVVALEVQIQFKGTWLAPQRMPLTAVTVNGYVLGLQMHENGNLAESRHWFIAAARAEGMPLEQVKALVYLFQISFEFGNLGEALDYLHQGRAILANQPDPKFDELRTMVIGNLGEVYRETGDVVKARFYTTHALENARRLQEGRAGAGADSQRSEMSCLGTLGELSFEQGDYATAIVWLDQANVLATAQADHEHLAVNHTFLALAKQRLAGLSSLCGAAGEGAGNGDGVGEGAGGGEGSVGSMSEAERHSSEVERHLDQARQWSTALGDPVLCARLASLHEGFEAGGGGGWGDVRGMEKTVERMKKVIYMYIHLCVCIYRCVCVLLCV
jgi:tetratricopeptide (TPR) repeat protein